MDDKLQLTRKLEQQLKDNISRYGHDSFFHYAMNSSDNLRLIICQRVVKDRTLISTSIHDSHYYGLSVNSKKLILDILAEDDHGDIYNIELQCYPITKNELLRFQCYLCAQVITQTQSGENYNIKPIRQLIINNSTPINGLNEYIHHFTYYDEEHGVRFPYSISEITFIQTYYLNKEIAGKEEISDFEQVMYLFKNDKVYDKMKPSQIVEEVVRMHKEYMDSKEAQVALERERELYWINTKMKEAEHAREDGLKEGEELGFKKGEELGKTIGIADTLIDILKDILTLSKEAEEIIRNADKEKLKELRKNILKIKSEEEVLKILQK